MGKNGEKKVMMIPNKIIIHCSATPKEMDYSAADIDKWHRRDQLTNRTYPDQ